MKLFGYLEAKFKYFISVHGVNSEFNNAYMKAMAPAGLLKSELCNVVL